MQAGAGSDAPTETRPLSRSLLRSTALVGLLTATSRLFGYVRDVFIANLGGAGVGTDAFFVAFRIPNLLRRLFAEGAFSQAFVPVIADYRGRRSHAEVRDLLAGATGSLGLVLLLLTAVGTLAAPLLILIFAPGFAAQPEKLALAAEMLRITLPYLPLVSLTALAGGALNAYDRFGVPALTPIFLNLAMIGAAIGLAPHLDQPVVALAWGVLAGGLLQLLFQLPFLRRPGLLVWPRLGFRHEGVRCILGRMLPAILGVSVVQINLMLDALLASFLETGSVSWLYYSDRLVELPLGVLGIALATVILPTLSRRFAEGRQEGFAATLDWALRWTLLVGVPATLGLTALAAPILATLFQHGEFRSADVYMAELSLQAYALGLPAFMLVKVLAPAFFARQDVRTPVRVAVLAVAANVVMSLMLMTTLAHAGLALATSLASVVNAALLYRRLHRDVLYRPRAGWGRFAVRLALANLALLTVLELGPPETAVWVAEPPAGRALTLALWLGAGAGAYLLTLWLLGYRKADLLPATRT
jgi:putative peptidoglycan lipid II flippase